MAWKGGIERTSDGIEFFPYNDTCIIPYSSKEFFDCFEGDKLIHSKFTNFLRMMYPNDNWDDFVNLEWEVEEEAKNYKWGREKNLGFILNYPILVDIKFYQGIGKIEKRSLKMGKESVRSKYISLVYTHKEPMMENLPSGICLISSVSIELEESHKKILNMILTKRYLTDTPSSLYSYKTPYYGSLLAPIEEWRIVPGLPSKVDEFLKMVEEVYDKEKFTKLNKLWRDKKTLLEAAATIKRIGKNVEDLEKEAEILYQQLNI